VNLFKLLKPAPHIAEISDSKKVDTEYKYWRIRIFYSMFIGYALYHFTRKSFTFAMPGLIEDLHFDKSELGILGSVLAITYGISKFTSGIMSDQSNPRYLMGFGLMLTGVFNIFFGFSSSLLAFALFWGLNGWVQGFGWAPCSRFLTQWYSHGERGGWWSFFNVSHNVGAFIIPWIVGMCLHYWGWRSAMCLPGVIAILGGFFLINRLRDTPQSLGLPNVEKYRNDYTGAQSLDEDKDKNLKTRDLLAIVLRNRLIWLLGIAYFFIYVLRIGIPDWAALYLIEAKGYGRLSAIGCVSLFEVGGFVGNLAAGWASDRLFGARRGPVNALCAIGALCVIPILWFAPPGQSWVDSCALFLFGFTIFGPQMLIGMAAAELYHKRAAATANGFVGTFAYMGAAFAGYPFGVIMDTWGWEGFFWALLACASLATAILIPLWGLSDRKSASTEISSIPIPVPVPVVVKNSSSVEAN
jgi:OPA family sugar phosphate sensor protein UhpC-like MFS transporter